MTENADESSDGLEQPGTTERSLDTLRQMLTDRGWRLSSINARYETWWHPDAPEEMVTVPTDREAGDFAAIYDRTVRRLTPDPTRTPRMEVGEPSGSPDAPQAFWVDLAIRVEAATPEDAIHEFVEGIVQGNLRGWVYGVRDEAGVLVGVFDGYGSTITREDIARQAEADDDNESVSERQDGDNDIQTDADADDEQLLSLATQLNQG